MVGRISESKRLQGEMSSGKDNTTDEEIVGIEREMRGAEIERKISSGMDNKRGERWQ